MDATEVSITPHTRDQLEMSNARSRGGWRLIFPPDRPNAHATLAYVIDHARKGDYEYTIVSKSAAKRVSQGYYFRQIEPNSQGVDPPDHWPDAWAAFKRGGTEAVKHAVRQAQARVGGTHE